MVTVTPSTRGRPIPASAVGPAQTTAPLGSTASTAIPAPATGATSPSVAELAHHRRQVATGARPLGGPVHPGRRVRVGQCELARLDAERVERGLEAVDPCGQEPDGVEGRAPELGHRQVGEAP